MSDFHSSLAHLIRSQRNAALGTLRDGIPFVSMVPYAEAADLSAFYLHLSRLAVHTQAIRSDPRVGLMISQPDTGAGDPQTLARVSIQGEAAVVAKDSFDFGTVRALYLGKFPAAELNFNLGDFDLYRITPRSGRYVADLGKIYDLREEDWKRIAD